MKNATVICTTTVCIASLAFSFITDHKYRKAKKDIHMLSDASSKLTTSYLEVLETSMKVTTLNEYLVALMKKKGVALDSFDRVAINEIMK